MNEQLQVKKQYGVFLSSTNDPLVRAYRLAAREVIEEEEFQEYWYVVEMDQFSPSTDSSLDTCRRLVLSCAVYIGLLGPFYGSVNDDVDISYTEYEYQVAREANRIIGVFMLPDRILSESDPKFVVGQGALLHRQSKFKDMVNEQLVSRPVKDIEDFKGHLRRYLRSITPKREALLHKSALIRYDLFVAAPMASLPNAEYIAMRQVVMDTIKHLEHTTRFPRIYFAGRQIETLQDVDPAFIGTRNDLEALRSSRHFLLIYPQAIVTSCLVEAGYAIAMEKPSFYFVKSREDLPYMLREAPDSYPFIHIFTYTTPKNLATLIDKYIFPVE